MSGTAGVDRAGTVPAPPPGGPADGAAPPPDPERESANPAPIFSASPEAIT